MLFSVEQAFVGREEIRAPLKTPAWEATKRSENKKSGSLGSAGEIDVNPFTPMSSVSSLVSSGVGRRDGGHFRLLQCCVLLTFLVVQNQNAGDHITSSKMIRFLFM